METALNPSRSTGAKVVRAAALVVMLALAGYFTIPLLRIGWKASISACPWSESWLALRRTQIRVSDPIAQASRVIRNEAGLNLVHTPKGEFWVPSGMEKILALFLWQQSAKIYGAGERGVHRGDIVLDGGANVGVFTREALNLGAARVIAIEPGPENVAALRRTFAAETETGQVVVYPKGIWDKDDVLTLNVFPHNSGADSFVVSGPAPHTEVKIPLTTIDNLVLELGLPRVDFIKLDIKGAAPKALAGAKQTLAAFHPRLAVSTEEPKDFPAFIQEPIASSWPGYRRECGMCELFREGFVPMVMFYR